MRAFLFERSFDKPVPPPPDPGPPPEPTVTVREAEEMVSAARQESYDKGYAEGVAQAREDLSEQVKTRIAESLEAVRRELPKVDSDLAEVLTDIEVRATRVILSLVSHFAPRLSDVIAQGLARDLVAKALSVAGNKPDLIVECSQEVSAFIKEAFDWDGDGQAITVRTDADLKGAAVKVRWEHGEVFWDPADTQSEVDALLAAAAETLE